MKLLLVAALVGQAFGTCTTWGSGVGGQTTGYTCTGKCLAATTKALTTAAATGGATSGANAVGVIGCAAGWWGTAVATSTTCETGGTPGSGKIVYTGCAACADQAGCTTNTANTCSTSTLGTGAASENRFKQCTAAGTGYYLTGTTTARKATACADQANCATNTATTCSTSTVGTENQFKQCTEASPGYFLSGTTTARKATACTVTSPAASVTCTTGATALLAADAVKVAEYGTIGCKAPNVGTTKVECKETGAAKPFTWSGCAAASAATATTMFGFVLTIIAMYL